MKFSVMSDKNFTKEEALKLARYNFIFNQLVHGKVVRGGYLIEPLPLPEGCEKLDWFLLENAILEINTIEDLLEFITNCPDGSINIEPNNCIVIPD